MVRINERLMQCPECGHFCKPLSRNTGRAKPHDPMIVPVNYTAEERHSLGIATRGNHFSARGAQWRRSHNTEGTTGKELR